MYGYEWCWSTFFFFFSFPIFSIFYIADEKFINNYKTNELTYSSNATVNDYVDNNLAFSYNNPSNNYEYGCIGPSNNNSNKHGSYKKNQKSHKSIANSFSANIYTNDDMYLNTETTKQKSGRITKNTTKYIDSENPNTNNNSMVKKLRIEINRIQIMYS